MLTGIRVVDMSRVLAGPVCTMMLGDLGADVIKVERPQGGDETRGWGPPFDERGESAYYLSCNRNKKSIALSLDDGADVAVLRQLIGGADVVVENFRPGALERRGIAAESLMAAHPHLLWCTIAGFENGSDRPGYDFVVQAELGWMSITGPREGPPTKTAVALSDVITGKDAAISILAALVARERGTRVARLQVTLAQSARAALMNVAQNSLVSGMDAPRYGNASANLVPYDLFDAADRAIVIAVGSDAQWLACARALELHELGDEAALATNAGRITHRERLVSRIAARVREAPASHWVKRLDAVSVPCGLVRSVLEALEGSGASALSGVPPSVPGSVRLPPPRLDEQGAEIRRSGWGAFRPADER